MNPERWGRIQEIFDQAIGRSSGERDTFLREACGEDGDLLEEVRSLLVADAAAGDFDDGLALPPSWPGRTLGPYRILKEIGEGGMSTVYLAARTDEEYERKVAVKIMRREGRRASWLPRFRRERQILANLNHPNIATLHDGGTTADGTPYFVMEWIDGESLLRYCDARTLSVQARLALFSAVCAAVATAHRNLIVHRDIKPANILVTREGIPKLLDFGIAKPLNPRELTQALEVSKSGEQPMTPFYASPEQLRGERVTTATDVYSLGIVLYELLTGRHPFRPESRDLRGTLEALLKQKARPPSLLFGRQGVGTGRQDDLEPNRLSRRRSATPRQLRRELEGDLDTIVLMALHEDAERRYSVEQLLEELRRYRVGRPLLARQEAFGYRASRFIRRHRWGVAAIGILVASALAFGIAMATLAAELTRERDQVRIEKTKAEEVSSFLISLFRQSDPYARRGRELTVDDLLTKGAEQLNTDLAEQPRLRATLMQTLAEVYESAGDPDRAEQLLERAIALSRQAPDENGLALASGLSRLARLVTQSGRLELALALENEALELRRRALGPRAPEVAESLEHLGLIVLCLGRLDDAREAHLQALEVRRELYGDDHPSLAPSYAGLGEVDFEARDLVSAETNYRLALEIADRHLEATDAFVLTTRTNYALLLWKQGDLSAAEQTYRAVLEVQSEILGEDHPKLGFTLNGLGNVLREQGEVEAAELFLNRALAVRRKIHPPGHPALGVSLTSLAALHAENGDFVRAEALYREAYDGVDRYLPAGSPHRAFPMVGLGTTLVELERFAEAEGLLRQALEIRSLHFPPDHPLITATRLALDRCLSASAPADEAERVRLDEDG